MMRSLKNVFIRECKTLFKDKRALAILLFVPILYTFLFGFLYANHIVKNINTAVINKSPSQLSRMIVNGFDKAERFNVKVFLENEQDLKPLFDTGEIDVVVYIPENFTSQVKKGENGNIFVGVNASNIIIGNAATASALQIVQTYSKGVLVKQFSATGLLNEEAFATAMPISIDLHPWFNPSYNYTNFLLLGIVATALQQITLMFIANSFARDNGAGILAKEGFVVSLLGKSSVYLLGTFISMQGAALAAFKLFGIPLRGEYLNILLMAIPFFFSIICLGFFIGSFCKEEGEATQLAMLIVYPAFLLTGFTWPIFSMPEPLQILAHCFPLTYFANAFRNIALMGIDFSLIQQDFIRLSILAVVYFIIAWLTFFLRRSPSFGTEEKKVKGC